MIGAMARHRVQVLRAAGKTLEQIVADTRVSQSTVQRIERERAIEEPGDLLQACERGVGRPSVVAPWRERLAAVLAAGARQRRAGGDPQRPQSVRFSRALAWVCGPRPARPGRALPGGIRVARASQEA